MVRTEHLTATEYEFPVVATQFSNNVADHNIDSGIAEYVSEPETTHHDGLCDIAALPTFAQVSADMFSLMHIPPAQSRYGESGSSSDISGSSSNYTSICTLNRDRRSRYSLRHIQTVDYNAAATVTSGDPGSPTVNTALNSQHPDEWIVAINKEFETILQNYT